MPCLILGVFFLLSYGIVVLCFVVAAIAILVAILAGFVGFGLGLFDPLKASAGIAFMVSIIALMVAAAFIVGLLVCSVVCGVVLMTMKALGCNLGSLFGGSTSNAIVPQPFPFPFPFPVPPSFPGLPNLPVPPGIDPSAYWKCLTAAMPGCNCDGTLGKGGLPLDPRELFTTVLGFINEARDAAERERQKLERIHKDLEEAGKDAIGEGEKRSIDEAKKNTAQILSQLEQTGQGLASEAGKAYAKLF